MPERGRHSNLILDFVSGFVAQVSLVGQSFRESMLQSTRYASTNGPRDPVAGWMRFFKARAAHTTYESRILCQPWYHPKIKVEIQSTGSPSFQLRRLQQTVRPQQRILDRLQQDPCYDRRYRIPNLPLDARSPEFVT